MKTALINLMVISFLFLIGIASSIAANLPFEIFQPQPNLDVKNRFYKAYPGLEYNVRLAVAGGQFPYQFTLVTAPSGMTIDTRGEVSWPNPTESDTPYQVTTSVTDSEGASQSVSWTITVTTTGFLFVDAINGTATDQGGTGTRSNPWKTMKDVYGGDDYDSKWANHHPGAFVYWREGEYILDAFFENNQVHEDGFRVPWSGRKPLVWITYPGETPEINFNSDGRDAYIFFYDEVENLYLDGFDFNLNGNYRGKGIAVGMNGNITVRKNIFKGLTNCANGSNNSHLFFTGGMGEYTSVQDNIASESCGYWLLGYDAPKTLVENNHITGDMPLPIGPKYNIQNWTIRGNYIQGQPAAEKGAIWLQNGGYFADIEINFNLIQTSGSDDYTVHLLTSNPGGSVYVNRNTLVGHTGASWFRSTQGPYVFSQNVIINNHSSPDKITRRYFDEDDEGQLVVSDNLVGDVSDNIVDSNGELMPDYAHFIGSRGHQLDSVSLDLIFTNGFE